MNASEGSGRKRPTMMDVAIRAGVSQATVSLVLNGSRGARLSVDTKERVREAASALGYEFVRRNPARTSPERSAIAFVADEITSDPWMALAFDGAREKALQHGINVSLHVVRGDPATMATVIEQILKLPLLGIIYGTILTRRVDVPAVFRKYRTVLVNCYDQKREFPSVLPGEMAAAHVATETLIRAGRRRVAIINGQDGLDASRDRLKGYRQALASHDLPFDPDLVRPGNWEPSAGYEMTRRLMQLPSPPDGIFCANDMMALGCLDALHELGLRIPQDVSVIGFDDREIAQFTRPPLTTFVLPQYEMGETAAEMLIDEYGTRISFPHRIKVECPIVRRASA